MMNKLKELLSEAKDDAGKTVRTIVALAKGQGGMGDYMIVGVFFAAGVAVGCLF